MVEDTNPTGGDVERVAGFAEVAPALTDAERIVRLERTVNLLMSHCAQLQGGLSLMIFQRSVDVISTLRKQDDPQAGLADHIAAIKKNSTGLKISDEVDPDIRALLQAGVDGALSDQIAALLRLSVDLPGGERLQA